MDDFYAARDGTKPPLPWPSIAPPFTGLHQDRKADDFRGGAKVAEWAAFSHAEKLLLRPADLKVHPSDNTSGRACW